MSNNNGKQNDNKNSNGLFDKNPIVVFVVYAVCVVYVAYVVVLVYL